MPTYACPRCAAQVTGEPATLTCWRCGYPGAAPPADATPAPAAGTAGAQDAWAYPPFQDTNQWTAPAPPPPLEAPRPLRPGVPWILGLGVAYIVAMGTFLAAFILFFTRIFGAAPFSTARGDVPPAGFFAAFFGLFAGELLVGGISLAQAFVTGTWLMRASRNVRGRGVAGMSWAPGWALGSWFIPYANFVIPLLVCRELWRASTPGAATDPAWRNRPIPAWVGWWWGLWVGSPILGMGVVYAAMFSSMLGRFSDPANHTLAPIQVSPVWFVVGLLPLASFVAALVLFARFVRTLAAMQDTGVAPES